MIENRKKIFVLTCLGYGTVDSTASAYSMIKKHLVESMEISETFLGLVDSATTLGTIIGIFLMIRLTHNICRNYLLCALLHSFCLLLLIPITKTSHYSHYSTYLLIIAMFSAGICKAAIVFPQILFSSHFNSNDEQHLFNVWYGLTFLGDTSGVLISKLIIVEFGWEVNVLFFAIFFILVGLSIYMFVPEPSSQPEEQVQSLSTTIQGMKGFLSSIPNRLIAADFVLEEILFFNIMLWMPYCFYLHHLESYDYIATLSFPICITLGALFFEYPLSFCKSYARSILTAMISISSVAFFSMFITPLQ